MAPRLLETALWNAGLFSNKLFGERELATSNDKSGMQRLWMYQLYSESIEQDQKRHEIIEETNKTTVVNVKKNIKKKSVVRRPKTLVKEKTARYPTLFVKSKNDPIDIINEILKLTPLPKWYRQYNVVKKDSNKTKEEKELLYLLAV